MINAKRLMGKTNPETNKRFSLEDLMRMCPSAAGMRMDSFSRRLRTIDSACRSVLEEDYFNWSGRSRARTAVLGSGEILLRDWVNEMAVGNRLFLSQENVRLAAAILNAYNNGIIVESGTFTELVQQYADPAHDFRQTHPEAWYPSISWCQKFLRRRGLKVTSLHGEAASVDQELVISARSEIQRVFQHYSPKDVFNVDETAFYYGQTIKKVVLPLELTSSQRGEKLDKRRVTLLLGANAAGTEWAPTQVIGNSARPRAPRAFHSRNGINVTSLWHAFGLVYDHNESSWQTRATFYQYMNRWNNELMRCDRKILVLVDNCSAHKIADKECFSNIRIHFLPPSTFSSIPVHN
jgi:hypothetical protein